MQAVPELGKLLVLSPHLDDAVFACAQLIARSADTVLVTLLAGAPSSDVALSDWDRAAGFQNTQQALTQRREEDRRALEMLDATPLWLDFVGSRHGEPPSVVGLAETIMHILQQQQPATVMLPAGLYDADHVLAHQAALLARSHHPELDWLLYEDTFYRRLPSQLHQRLISLIHFGIDATPVSFDTHAHDEHKRQAVQCYASQLRALNAAGESEQGDIFAPEGYWRLTTAPLTY